MSTRDYRRMPITEFGEALLKTQDLDPAYVMLRGARLDDRQLRRFCVAYWSFYHAGSAAWLSEQKGDDFWNWMLRAAQNVPAHAPPVKPGERWPRASERRYFRGPKCIKAVEWMANRWDTPEELVEHLEGMSQPIGEPRTERTVMRAVDEMPLFGPWIGFKIADMFERVLNIPVKFSPDIGLIYKSPRAELDLLAQEEGGTPAEHWDSLLGYFKSIPAPPDFTRGCGPQECETIACKHFSHRTGHYRVGKDIKEISQALGGWGDTARHLSMCLPEDVDL